MKSEGREHPWRCTECNTLLGVERGSKLHFKYKRAQYAIEGDALVMAVCRYCSHLNERKTPPTTARDCHFGPALHHEPAPVS